MSTKKHGNQTALDRLARQAKNRKRRKPPAPSDAGSRPAPVTSSFGRHNCRPGLSADSATTARPQGATWDGD